MTSFISESPAAPPDQAILKANLQALARHAPRLVRELEQTTPRRDITFSPSEQDVLTGELDSRALASRRRPLDEARRWADGIDLTKAGGVVVLGFGLGHHIGALAQRCRGISCIVVFEPDLGLLRAVLEHIDHSAWLAHAQLIMLTDATNASVMSQAVCGHEGPLAVGIEFVEHPPSRPRLREHASRFTETFARVFGALRTNVITTMMQTDVTVRNELMNVEHYVGCPGIADLTDMCAGKPAIVVAAGPSLERNIHLLTSPGAQQRCVIIAVQTVLRQLLEAGIRPHFVTAIDYHEISKRFYEGLTADDVEGVTLVAAARANPAILDAYPGDIRIPEDDFLDELLGPDFARDRGALPPAATVAHHAYYLARALGADPVILVGQDLAFTDGQYYARGAAIHDVWAPELNAFNTLEMMEWQRIVRTRATLHRATDHLGRPVYTDEQMATYLAQFERDFLPDVEAGRTVIDATEGGVQKRHTTAMPLADALAQYASDDAAQVPDALRATPVRSTQRHADAEARLEDVRGGVRSIARRSRKSCDLLESMLRVQKDIRRTSRLIDQVNAIRDEVHDVQPAFSLVMRLNQMGALKRFKADRMLKLVDDLDRFERQRRQIARDKENLQWLADFADLLDELLDIARGTFSGGPKRSRDVLPAEDDATDVSSASAQKIRCGALLTIASSDIDRLGHDFLGAPILRRTLQRVARCAHIDALCIATDDPTAVRTLVGDRIGHLDLQIRDAPLNTARAEQVAVARAWADTCWRGGLGGITCFDEALDPVAAEHAMQSFRLDAALVAGPDWALVDPELCDALIERHAEHPSMYPLTFTQAPPGLAGAVVSRDVIADLASGARADVPFASIGGAIAYIPTHPRSDPIARPCCVQIDASLRSTCARFVPGPDGLLEAVLGPHAAHLDTMSAAEIAEAVRTSAVLPPFPKEITLDPSIDGATDVITALGTPGALLTLHGGDSDPLECTDLQALITLAHGRGLRVHVRTHLQSEHFDPSALIASGVDIISADLHASTAETYHALTGMDAFRMVLERFETLVDLRHVVHGLPKPWVVPRITRRDAVYEEIETFFDQWTMRAGCAVIDPLSEAIAGDRIEPLGTPRPALLRDAMRRITIGSSLLDPARAWSDLCAHRRAALDAGQFDDASLQMGW